MDKGKIEYDALVNWKFELKADQKVLNKNYEKSSEKVIQENVRLMVFINASDKIKVDEAQYNLQVAQEEKDKCEKEMRQHLDLMESILVTIDNEISKREAK